MYTATWKLIFEILKYSLEPLSYQFFISDVYICMDQAYVTKRKVLLLYLGSDTHLQNLKDFSKVTRVFLCH